MCDSSSGSGLFDGVVQDPVGAGEHGRGGGEVLAEFGDGAGLPAVGMGSRVMVSTPGRRGSMSPGWFRTRRARVWPVFGHFVSA